MQVQRLQGLADRKQGTAGTAPGRGLWQGLHPLTASLGVRRSEERQSETQVQSLSGVESAIDTTSQSVNTVNQGEETISSAPITYTVNQANDLNNQTVSAEPMVNQVVEPVTSDIVNQANDLSNQTITPGVYDPSSIFMASVDQKIPEPVTIPAQPTPVVNPTQMPGADSQVSPAIQSSELGGTDNL